LIESERSAAACGGPTRPEPNAAIEGVGLLAEEERVTRDIGDRVDDAVVVLPHLRRG